MADSNSYQAKGIEVLAVEMVNYNRSASLDLKRICLEFNIYEDIFGGVITGDMTISDSIGVVERFPLIGEELVYIAFKTPDISSLEFDTYEKLFYVYKVDKREKFAQQAEIYTIHLMGIENLASLANSVDRSWSGNTVSQIVRNVYENNLQIDEYIFGIPTEKITERKEIFVEDTTGLHNIVSPGETPLNFINYLTRVARSDKYIESDFVFYEDKDQFNFRTLSSIIDSEAVEDYYWDYADVKKQQKEVASGEGAKPYQIIADLSRETEFDVIKNYTSGLLDNSVDVLDFVLKLYAHQPFNYYDETELGTFTNLEKHRLITPYNPSVFARGGSFTRLINSQYDYDEAEYRNTSYIAGRTRDNQGNVLDPVAEYPSTRHKFLNYRTSKLAQLQSIVFTMSIPGDSRRKAGEIVHAYIPWNNATKQAESIYNPFLGVEEPRFLVTAVNHNYKQTTGEYRTTLEIVKDSYAMSLRATDNSGEQKIENTNTFELL